jgi:hypothetical protein
VRRTLAVRSRFTGEGAEGVRGPCLAGRSFESGRHNGSAEADRPVGRTGRARTDGRWGHAILPGPTRSLAQNALSGGKSRIVGQGRKPTGKKDNAGPGDMFCLNNPTSWLRRDGMNFEAVGRGPLANEALNLTPRFARRR